MQSNPKPTIVLRADADAAIGAGHVMRCLALAQEWIRCGGDAHLVMATDPRPFSARLSRDSIPIHRISVPANSRADFTQTADIASRVSALWVILDGYHLTSGFQEHLKRAGNRVLVIDDNGEQDHYYADVILNPNIYSQIDFYPAEKRERYTKLLLGTDYVLLRKEFYPYRRFRRTLSAARRHLLVLMGSGDLENMTSVVLAALSRLKRPDIWCRIVVGPNNPHVRKLEGIVSDLTGRSELLSNVEDMPKLYAWADCAVTATGSTCYELNFMQVPFLNIVVARNQARLDQMIVELKGVSLGWFHSLTIDNLATELRRFLDSPSESFAPRIHFGDFVAEHLMRPAMVTKT